MFIYKQSERKSTLWFIQCLHKGQKWEILLFYNLEKIKGCLKWHTIQQN